MQFLKTKTTTHGCVGKAHSAKAKMTFWEVNPHGKDCLYQWQFLSFGTKNALAKFQKVMDCVLARFGFAKCYIDDITVFSMTLKDRMQYLQEVFERFKDHNLKLHPGKCWFFKHMWNTWVICFIQVDWKYKRPRLGPFHMCFS
jgi:hypothetical protein